MFFIKKRKKTTEIVDMWLGIRWFSKPGKENIATMS
jgi:hypothetical protein